jgi:hypothetical protein
MADDETIEFNFEGVEPAVFGAFVVMPKGEYNLQCTGLRKYYKGDKGGTIQGDINQPGLEFTMTVSVHGIYEGKEFKLYHPFKSENEKFLLNTLMCLLPDFDWQRNGLKIPLSALIERAVGRPANGLISWKVETYTKEGETKPRTIVKNELNSLKPFDQSITQPVATEGNPPILTSTEPSAIAQQAAAGVSPDEVNSFLNEWPGGSPAPAAPASGFGDEPF